MEEKWNSRTELLIGTKKLKKLEKSKVIIYGIGGVGSFAVEGLARAGVGHLILVDNDYISISNLNRQIHSNINTVGKKKTETMKQRILEINPEAIVETYMPQEMDIEEENLINSELDYIIDSVDTVATKIRLIEKANEFEVPIISSMGAGYKMNPTKFEVSDIYKTSVCPLAKVIRKELRKRNIKKLKVVYSREEPKKEYNNNNNNGKNITIGSISFIPSVVGLIIASEVIKDLIK